MKNKWLIAAIKNSKNKKVTTSFSLDDFKEIIFELRKKSFDSKIVILAGLNAKDNYIKECIKLGIPKFIYEETIKDNGDGTFTITT